MVNIALVSRSASYIFLGSNDKVSITGIFASNKNTRTFNFQAGDVGSIPAQFGHYLECISKEPCKYLEIFKAAEIQDLSLAQWMALTPTHIIKDTLRVDPKFIRGFNKEKQFVVPPV